MLFLYTLVASPASFLSTITSRKGIRPLPSFSIVNWIDRCWLFKWLWKVSSSSLPWGHRTNVSSTYLRDVVQPIPMLSLRKLPCRDLPLSGTVVIPWPLVLPVQRTSHQRRSMWSGGTARSERRCQLWEWQFDLQVSSWVRWVEIACSASSMGTFVNKLVMSKLIMVSDVFDLVCKVR